MVYHLTFEEMNQLMKQQIMSSSSSPPSSELSSCNVSHVPLITSSTPPTACLSENNLLMQCMQKLGQYPACDSRLVLQESNGQIVSRGSTKGEGVDEQHTGGSGGGCTPRPRWCPTPEQIQVLETLFNSGTTTPSRDMIVEIAACLKQFGNIVEANVFYWFQNRKARAKRKLRMQAQLQQQQQSSRSTDSDQPHSAPPQSSHHALNAPPTSRRVCAKTAGKTSPDAFAASDDQLSPLMHLLPSVNHADQHAAEMCSLVNMHDHNHAQHAAAACCMIMPPPLYAAGDCNASLPMINGPSGSSISCSSSAERPLCHSSRTAMLQKESFDEHALHRGISQAMSLSMISHAPALLPSDHEHADYHYNVIQNHAECDQQIGTISSYNTARASSHPGRTDTDNVIISNCSMLQHSVAPEPSSAAQGAASVHSHLYRAAAADFNRNSPGNHKELSSAGSNYIGDPYAKAPAAYTSISTGACSYPNQMQDSLRMTLPSKRNWMDALMLHFELPEDISPYNTSCSPTTHMAHNLYNNVDCYTARAADTNDLLNHPIPSNLLLQQPRLLSLSTEDAPAIYNIPICSNLSEDAMESTHSSITTNNEAHDGINTKQHMQGSPPPQAASHELHDAVTITKRVRAADPPSLSCNSTHTSQQQTAFATSSSNMLHRSCDHLPLWEALAPYMTIGS